MGWLYISSIWFEGGVEWDGGPPCHLFLPVIIDFFCSGQIVMENLIWLIGEGGMDGGGGR